MSFHVTGIRVPRLRELGKTYLVAPRGAKFLIFATILGVGLWGAYKASSREELRARSAAGPRAQAVPVVAADVTRGDFPVVFSGLGTVTASATSIVKTQAPGQLLEVKFTEGQLVKAGDVLAQIDPRPYQLALAQAEGQYQKDLALLQNAERDLARYETLLRRVKDAVSTQQIDAQRSLINQYKAAVAIDQALVDQARLNLSYCQVVSPIDGRIGLRPVDQGNYVQTNDANGVAVVTRLSPITVIFSLPEIRLQSVLRRFRSGETLTVVAFDHERSTELARGRLYAIDNQIDASSGTVKLRAEFLNDDEHLYPNQFVNAELLVETLHDAVLVPAAAVQRGAKGPFVYIVNSENTVSTRPVKPGPGDGDRVVVEGGLDVGERVVVEGVDRLRDGSKVSLPSRNVVSDGKPRPERGTEGSERSRGGAS